MVNESEIQPCAICLTQIEDQDHRVICYNCDHQFHFDHLQTWLRRTSYCPYCKITFSFDFMRMMRPNGNTYLKPKFIKQSVDTVIHQKGQDHEPDDIGAFAAKIGFLIVTLFLVIFIISLF